MGRYVPHSQEEKREMLSFLGLSSEEELFRDVPPEALLHNLNLPEGLSELEVLRTLTEKARRNQLFESVFRGAGAYRHYIPEIVKTVTSKEEFLTAYTPYQAEISQGVLQSIFEYQTEIAELTGMDVSNASVYDGAVAAAEAVYMCEDRKRTGCAVSASVNPEVLSVIRTYCESRNVEVTVIPAAEGRTDLQALKAVAPFVAGVYAESPNYYGLIEETEEIAGIAHEAGALFVAGVNPISLGLLKCPGEYGADIAVGEGQPLGLPMGFGGPYLGFMACKKALMRKLPGRIVGETKDHEGRRAYVLTLQAREQHIRREKASSNICSNEALCAMTAAVYLAAVGPEGLRTVAESCFRNAHYLADELEKLGFFRPYAGPFFHEFVTTCPVGPRALEEALSRRNILSGLPIEGGMLWCATELNDKADVDRLIQVLKEVL